MRYRSFRSILPWMVVHPASHKVSRVSWYSGYRPVGISFVYGGFTFCAAPSQKLQLEILPFMPVLNPGRPKTSGLGSSLFARRYYGNHYCFLFLQVLRCFSSLGFFFLASAKSDWALPQPGSPIRISPDRCLFTTPRSVSPLTASFISC